MTKHINKLVLALGQKIIKHRRPLWTPVCWTMFQLHMSLIGLKIWEKKKLSYHRFELLELWLVGILEHLEQNGAKMSGLAGEHLLTHLFVLGQEAMQKAHTFLIFTLSCLVGSLTKTPVAHWCNCTNGILGGLWYIFLWLIRCSLY